MTHNSVETNEFNYKIEKDHSPGYTQQREVVDNLLGRKFVARLYSVDHWLASYRLLQQTLYQRHRMRSINAAMHIRTVSFGTGR